MYGITDSATEGLFGGWAQKVYLEPGVVMAKLPDGVAFEDYIGGGCGLLTAVHIIERAKIVMGDTVVVQGAGAVGMCTAALARQAGAGQVIVIDPELPVTVAAAGALPEPPALDVCTKFGPL